MHKCYTFLIFMVLLLPSLGLSRWVLENGMGARVGDCWTGSHLPYRARGTRQEAWPSPGLLTYLPCVWGASPEAHG